MTQTVDEERESKEVTRSYGSKILEQSVGYHGARVCKVHKGEGWGVMDEGEEDELTM